MGELTAFDMAAGDADVAQDGNALDVVFHMTYIVLG